MDLLEDLPPPVVSNCCKQKFALMCNLLLSPTQTKVILKFQTNRKGFG